MADGCNHFSFSGAAGSMQMAAALPGPPGPAGKSAYEAAVEGGYTGTEAQFNAALAEVDTALQPSDVDAELSASSTNPVQNKVVTAALDGKAGIIRDTASGDVATFTPDASVPNLLGLTVEIQPVQEGRGDPSPTNVRPVTGWDSVRVWNASNYDPTAQPSATIQLGRTAYGGTLDTSSGVFLITWVRVDLSTLEWVLAASESSLFRCNLPTRKYGTDEDGIMGFCNTYTFYGNRSVAGLTAQLPNLNMGYQTTNGRVWIRNDAYTTADSFAASLSGQYLVYELATPLTVRLLPQEISALPGVQNNVWADCGPVTVEYAVDLKTYIDARTNATRAMIAGIEADMTASRAYATGELLIVGDTLYKAAAPIASGAALTPGTNVNATTVAEQLLLLFNS